MMDKTEALRRIRHLGRTYGGRGDEVIGEAFRSDGKGQIAHTPRRQAEVLKEIAAIADGALTESERRPE